MDGWIDIQIDTSRQPELAHDQLLNLDDECMTIM